MTISDYRCGGTIRPIGSAVSNTQNAIIAVAKDTLPEAAMHSKGAPFKAKTPKKPGNRGKQARAKWVKANRESDSTEDSLEDSMVCRIKDREV